MVNIIYTQTIKTKIDFKPIKYNTMKTKTRTKQLKAARANKSASKLSTGSKVVEYVKTGVFFAVPVVLIVCAIMMRNSSFNAF